MSEQPEANTLTSQDEFDLWMFNFDEALASFRLKLPEDVAGALDNSAESLLILENWLLGQYPSTDEILKASEAAVLDACGRYVGRVFKIALDGRWTINVTDQDDVFFGLPTILFSGGKECPLSLVTAALDRRTGTFISNNLSKKLKRLNVDI